MHRIAAQAIKTVLAGGDISRAAALALIEVPLPDLLHGAHALRMEFHGTTVSLCAIVNARSGTCGEDCAFCAQSRRYATAAPVYPLLGTGDIVRRAQAAVRMKARHFGIVTSGRSLPAGELENVCEAIRAVREMGNPIPCASLGALERGTAATLRDAGLRRYHHNLETSARFFPLVCTTHTWEDRLRTVTAARDAGLEICSGGIFGLGESWGDRVDLGIALRDEGAHSVPLNFLMPIKGTPMEDREPLAASEALRVIALFRFLLPRAEIRVAGGRESVLGGMQPMILHAGADGMMVGDYLTMKGRPPEEDLRMIEQLGLDIG